jgi:hypothetical protein
MLVKKAIRMWNAHFETRPTLFVAAHQPLAVSHAVARFISHRWAPELHNVTTHVFRNTKDPTFDSFHIWVGTQMGAGEAQTLEYECRGTFGMTATTKMDDVLTALVSPPTCSSLALNDDFDYDTPEKLITNINVLLDHIFPQPSPLETDFTPLIKNVIDYECAFSGASVHMPVQAFFVPESMYPYHTTWTGRQQTGWNRNQKSAQDLFKNYHALDLIESSNDIASTSKRELRSSLHVTQWNARYGKNWCESSIHIRFHPALNKTDFWLVSGQVRSV